MQIGRIEGATRVLGQSQGYLGLPVRDEVIECDVGGFTPAMVTVWLPTAEEIAAIAAGAPIYLRLLGTAHPPVLMFVGEPPE